MFVKRPNVMRYSSKYVWFLSKCKNNNGHKYKTYNNLINA